MAPAVTQVNDKLPSLIVDMVLSNVGAHHAVISDVVIHLRSNGKDTGIALHAQNILNRDVPLGALPLVSSETLSAVFLPILVTRNETKAFRICCTLWQSDLPFSEAAILQTNQIQLDLFVNGKLRSSVFVLGYNDYRDKFKGNGIVEIPDKGFAPRWYPEKSAVVLSDRGFRRAWPWSLNMKEEQSASGINQKLKALEAFKDWSNYLLVTTVAALGWTTAKDGATFSALWIKDTTILLFALSVVLAILTLALIPHIGEDLTEKDLSIYDVGWKGWFGGHYELMDLCFPQHLLFLLGIVFYGGGTAFHSWRYSLLAIGITIAALLLLLLAMLHFIWKPRSSR